ncbi:lytic murein transglycosylase [Erwinia sp. MMLR14_017]|uniref:lytic murein transglycosylase n=1 Tax=Erwinia sp. MMLR14_017 TaxID=3093842 RepID=UPI0029904C77|nr:lytic murein transglycosylase [Erwinia sp. MMLR14_017]MDW8846355.1 lytic murein transglycosylase [Erwinia sp. MMLR14_017]
MKLTSLSTVIFSLILAGCASKNSAAPAPEAPVPARTATPAPAKGGFLQAPTKTTLAAQGRNPAEFPAYVEQLKAQARQQGVDQSTLESAFANVHFVDHVINSDRNQLEQKVTLSDYLSRVMTEKKIQQGRESLQRYQAQLMPIAQRSGVQPQYIVALWAMESSFGKIQGREDVISALATLAFEGRREAFFTKELFAALQIIQQQHIAADEMKGSWAGAMGQNQFMPSSFMRYGADGDGDGKIDIWNSVDDVFASTANYLAKEGWKPGESWGREVILPVDFVPEMAGLKEGQSKTVGEWEKLGIRLNSDQNLPDTHQRAWIVTPDDIPGRVFMVYDNFRTIMRWNRSYYFAISIGMMADAISQ